MKNVKKCQFVVSHGIQDMPICSQLDMDHVYKFNTLFKVFN